MIYLTGSKALDHHCKTPFNLKKDWDFIASEEDLEGIGLSFDGQDSFKKNINGLDCEFLNMDFLNNREICRFSTCLAPVLINFGVGDIQAVRVLDIESLYVQKRSHCHRPINFVGHIMQLQKIKDHKSFMGLDAARHRLLKERTYMTKKVFKDNVPSLNQSNKDFFDDAVKKFYVHDDIHEVMAFYDAPIYERLKRDMESAKCEKDLWEALSEEDKKKCVAEECFVIGVERFLIPKLENGERYLPSTIAFYKALEKVCTTLTSGWFRDYAIDNWLEISELGKSVDFYGKFFSAKESGELQYA